MTADRICAALLTLTIVAAAGSMPERLRSAASAYYAHAATAATRTSRDTTMDYYRRLLDDADMLSDPASQRSPARLQILETQAQLDISLAQQLLSGAFVPMNTIRGAGETFVRSSQDGTMQPVAVYVPERYSPDRPTAVVVFLHGRLQPESQLIAPLFLQTIAEETGTIIVAPYGRGSYDFDGAERDVYDAFDAAVRAFRIGRSERYLAGFSMGAVSIFKIALMRPDAWSASIPSWRPCTTSAFTS